MIFNKKYRRLLTFLSVILFTNHSFGQVTPNNPTNLVQNFNIHIDKMGDADMDVTQKMTASQWESFKQSPIYNDPALAKRDMERNMATYVIEDFKRDIDEMNQTVKLSMKVISYAQYKGNGHWQLTIGSKDPEVTKLTEKAYMITGNTVMGSNLVQQIFKIYFPSGASGVTQTTDDFGKAIFTYNSGGGLYSYIKWNNIVGVILILVAILLLLKSSPFLSMKTSRA